MTHDPIAITCFDFVQWSDKSKYILESIFIKATLSFLIAWEHHILETRHRVAWRAKFMWSTLAKLVMYYDNEDDERWKHHIRSIVWKSSLECARAFWLSHPSLFKVSRGWGYVLFEGLDWFSWLSKDKSWWSDEIFPVLKVINLMIVSSLEKFYTSFAKKPICLQDSPLVVTSAINRMANVAMGWLMSVRCSAPSHLWGCQKKFEGGFLIHLNVSWVAKNCGWEKEKRNFPFLSLIGMSKRKILSCRNFHNFFKQSHLSCRNFHIFFNQSHEQLPSRFLPSVTILSTTSLLFF